MGVCLYEIATLFLCYCCCFTVLSFTCHLSFLFVKNKNYNLLTFYYPVIKKTFLSSNKTVFHIVILWSSQFMVHTGWGCSVLCVGPPGMLQLLVLCCVMPGELRILSLGTGRHMDTSCLWDVSFVYFAWRVTHQLWKARYDYPAHCSYSWHWVSKGNVNSMIAVCHL